MTADQPLFVPAKQIQWQWPDLYGQEKFMILFSGPYTEAVRGDLLKGSDMGNSFNVAEVASSGRLL
jgi:hypothetical protein